VSIRFSHKTRCDSTPPKHEDEVCGSNDDLTMFDSSYINEEEDESSSNPDDCCHHIKNVSVNVQMCSIFITSLIITN
jgi:hypothetical protein